MVTICHLEMNKLTKGALGYSSGSEIFGPCILLYLSLSLLISGLAGSAVSLIGLFITHFPALVMGLKILLLMLLLC